MFRHSMKSRIQHQIEKMKIAFFQLNEGAFDSLLCAKRLEVLAQQSGSYRDKLFTPIVTLQLFLWQGLSDNGSCKQAVAHFISGRIYQKLPVNSSSSGPYCKARQRLSLAWVTREVQRIGSSLHTKAATIWSWKGLNVLLVDGTTVLMPDTQANQARYPKQGVQKPGLGFPIARLVGLISLSTGAIVDYAMVNFKERAQEKPLY